MKLVEENSHSFPLLDFLADMEPELALLLHTYGSIFANPTSLPPPRSHDHFIPLLEGSNPMKVKPYRYPHSQKEEIEILAEGMLREGIIQPIRSPFSSLIILVKKKDGSWRVCTDDRALNAITIEYSFPIPTVDELINELFGAYYFVLSQTKKFPTRNEFSLSHVPREQNSRTDLLSKLVSTKKLGATQEASLLEREATRFVVILERLYRRGFSTPLLRCLTTSQAQRLMEEIHGDMGGSHIGGRSLVYKVTQAGYFWLTLRNDCVNWVQKYNGTQFASGRVCDFCREIGIRMMFTSVENSQSNGQAESVNKVILLGLKKRIQDFGASWVEELPRVLWSYHMTIHSSTQDTPFNLVYGIDAMIPIEISEPTVCTTYFSEEESE
uniref:Transposon Ty3-I Gag-Pol polyprotein n=1 Tax=Cajanus cajan TaxID=3821 RepID=A0A151RH17_CAJCA|nr:Transposon Ty3-I Gag-Pol polyprotein [Cajanus cajan]